MKYWLMAIAASCTLATAAQQAQTPAPQSQAPSKAAAAPAKADKSCIAAGRKLDRERNSLAYAKDETERYTKASQTCATKSTCARYKAALDSLEKRIARHERRIDTFTANRDKVCKT